jgi:hypothetical protein
MNKGILIATLLVLFSAPLLRGQPWIGQRGETTLTMTYQRTEHEGHVLNDGTWLRVGGSHASVIGLTVEHNLTDKFAISAGIPYVASKFARNNGPNMTLMCPTCPGLDDGRYHGAWQDVTLGARYNVLMHPVVLTPSLSVRFPSHRYATEFEAAPGRHLVEAQAGIAAGRIFDPAGLPFYVTGQYSYAFVEKVFSVSNDRSNADLTVGTFLAPTFSVHGFVSWQNTHGGLTSDFVLNFDNKILYPALYRAHDGLIRDNFWRGGIGASYALTESTGVSASIARVLGGTNTHFGYLYNLSVSRSFQGSRQDR